MPILDGVAVNMTNWPSRNVGKVWRPDTFTAVVIRKVRGRINISGLRNL